MKTQTIRLVDVFLLGPFMIWYASRSSGVSPLAREALLVAGVATIIYNGINYLEAK